MPILLGLDGKMKMSKSLGNAISLQDTSKEMFGKIMSIPDDLIISYFQLLTDLQPQEIAEMQTEMQTNGKNPKIYKEKLAENIVSLFYGEETAKKSVEEFAKIFSKKENPEEMPDLAVNEAKADVVKIIESTGKFKSKSEIIRLIKGGGVRYNGEKITKDQKEIEVKNGAILKVGKLHFFRLKKI